MRVQRGADDREARCDLAVDLDPAFGDLLLAGAAASEPGGRQDLLQMLLSQVREVSRLKESVSQLEGRTAEQAEALARLNRKLDDRDKMINDLRAELEVDPEDPDVESLGKVVNKLNKAVNLFEAYSRKLRNL